MIRKFMIGLAVVAYSLLSAAPVHAVSLFDAGLSQYYTIQLRGDDKTLVYASIILDAPTDAERTSVKLTLPDGVTAGNFAAQQMIVTQRSCEAYENVAEWRQRTQPAATDAGPFTYDSREYEKSKQCLAYDTDPYDYRSILRQSTARELSFYETRSKEYGYKDAAVTTEGGSYMIQLPEPVKAGEQGAVILSYTSDNYSSNFLGVHSYKFRTLLADEPTTDVSVMVNFDSELYSRAADQARTSESTPDIAASDSINVGPSSAGSDYYPNYDEPLVRQGGSYFKSQDRMIAGDTLEVSGVFSKHKALLYGKEVMLSLLVAIGFVALGWLVNRLIRYYRKTQPVKKVVTKATGHTSVVDTMATLDKLQLAGISAVSIVVTVVALAILVLVGLGTDTWSFAAYVQVVGVIAISALSLVIAPLLYVARYGYRTAFNWSLIHGAIILALTATVVAVSAVFSTGNGY